MRVRYVINNNTKIEGEDGYSNYLIYNKEYMVYGIEYLNNGNVKFMISDDITPVFYPDSFFEVTDNRISKYWEGTKERYYPLSFLEIPALIIFKDALEYYFFDQLLDNSHSQTVKCYWENIELMNNEFPDTNLKNAYVIDKNWLMCSYCEYAWETNSKNGIVICPKCSHKNNNPFWRGVPNGIGNVSN